MVQEVASEEAGAIATFSGTARRHSRGRVVSYLDYEGYEGMAEEMMAKLAAALQERYGGSTGSRSITGSGGSETRAVPS